MGIEQFGNYEQLPSKISTNLKLKKDMKSIKEPTELQKLQWENKALIDALQYLVDTKERKDTIGKDAIYMQRKNLGWLKAKKLLGVGK